MATIQRPIKTYGTRTYVAEVAAAPSNQDPILANEVDGDIDTIYSAWNGGADTVNIKDGAISRAKLSTTDVTPSLPPIPIATDANKTVVVNAAGNGLILGTGGTFAGATPPATPQVGQLWWRSDPDGNLFIYYDDGNSKQFVPAVPSSVGPWSVSGATLTPTDATKRISIPGPTTGSDLQSLTLGSRTQKTRLGGLPSLDGAWLTVNQAWNGSAWTRDDAAQTAGILSLQPSAANAFLNCTYYNTAGTPFQLLTLDNLGNLTLTGSQVQTGTATVKGHFACSGGQVQVYCNNTYAPQDSTLASWEILMDSATAGNFVIIRRAPNAAAGTQSQTLYFDTGGNLTISGPTGQKSAGTTWSNPSDPRLKQDIAPYAAGLAEIAQLEPITYRLNAQPDLLCYGFDAAKVRDVFPECVSTTRMKLDPADEEETDDVLVFDMHPILVALINAVKELAEKVGQ